ncbi:MAG: AP2 domain-containing protein, partial [Candidatus Kariarchaeaceae archaeon]
MGVIKDLSGQRFERLVVLDFAYIKNHKAWWNCKCDCGNITQVPAGDLRSGKVISCGCNTTWKGENNPRWKGGIYRDKYKYPALWTKKLK